MQLNTTMTQLSQWIELQSHVVQSPEFSELLLRAETDFAGIKPPDRARIMAHMSNWAMLSETDMGAISQGVFLEALSPMINVWKARLRLPAYREYFNEYSSYHSPEFVQFINSIIQEDAS